MLRENYVNFNGFRSHFDDAREEVQRNFHLLERISCRFQLECIYEELFRSGNLARLNFMMAHV